MVWVYQKQCLNCNEKYDKSYTICPYCKVECKNSFQSMYWEITVWYKLVESRILTPEEFKKNHCKKSNRAKYADRWFAAKALHCKRGWRYDDWYDRDWYNEDWFDRDWYNRKWFNPETKLHKNGTYFDDDWYDIDWYNKKWYDKYWHTYGRDPIEEEKKEKDKRDEIKRLLW